MLTRRRLITSGLGATVGLALGDGTQPAVAQREAAPPGRRQIVDAQVHLWQPEGPDRPWIPGMKPQLPEPFGYPRLLGLMDEAGVNRVVIVPPSWEGDRIDYGLEAAAKHPDRFGVMGRIPLAAPGSSALIPTWKQQRGMLGIRVTFLGPQGALLTNGTADWLWPAAEKAGIPIMFLAGELLPRFGAIAERHPGLPIIADHMGLNIDLVKANKTAEAISHTVALAKYPNVSVKLSATPAYSAEAYPWKDMTPHIKRLYDVFGPQRCYWGTDMTNSFDKATYKQRVTHVTETLDFLSEPDKDWVMGRAIMARLGWA